MALTYTVAGVLAGLFGANLAAAFQDPWIVSAFALVFVLLALSMFGFYELQMPASWQARLAALSHRQRGGTYAGVGAMGALSALIVGPCVAAPLAGVLIYIGRTGDPVLGGVALFALGMGMGVPLMVAGVSAGKLLPKAGADERGEGGVRGDAARGRDLPAGARGSRVRGAPALGGAVHRVRDLHGALDSLSAASGGWRRPVEGRGPGHAGLRGPPHGRCRRRRGDLFRPLQASRWWGASAASASSSSGR